jgi:hypothetical protein
MSLILNSWGSSDSREIYNGKIHVWLNLS